MEDQAAARDAMVRRQIEARGIVDPAVLAAMRDVPREAFVAEGYAEHAYEDSALPIEAGQTISQPYIVALMIEAARIGPADRVLEVGTGSGYAAAVASLIAAEVFAIERHEALARLAKQRLARLAYANVHIRAGDGSAGWPEHAPFDAILVPARSARVPAALKEQLAIGGRLVIPIGGEDIQQLIRLTRTGEDDYTEDRFGDVRFVPLIQD